MVEIPTFILVLLTLSVSVDASANAWEWIYRTHSQASLLASMLVSVLTLTQIYADHRCDQGPKICSQGIMLFSILLLLVFHVYHFLPPLPGHSVTRLSYSKQQQGHILTQGHLEDV